MPVILLLLAAVCARSESSVRGTVLDPENRAVSGARVLIAAPSGAVLAESRSGQSGEFTIPFVGRGSFNLVAESEGLARAGSRIELPSEREFRLQLSLVPQHSEITVTASRGFVEQTVAADAMVEARAAEAFRIRPMPTIAHALEGSPGILLQQTSTSQVSPFLRGLTGYQVLNLIDGIRFNNSTFRSGPNQYLAFIEPSQAQRIESALGPSSSQYGSDSLGGAIQVITRETRFGDPGPVQVHGDWNLYGGSADASAGSDAHVSISQARWAWLGGLSGRRHNDLRPGRGFDSRHVFRRHFGLSDSEIRDLSGGRQQDTAFSQWGADTKFSARLTPEQLVSVWYQRSSQEGARNYKDLWGGLGRLQSDLEPQDLHFAYARYEKLRFGWIDTLSGTFSANAQGDGSRRQNLRATDPLTIDNSQVNVFGYSAQATTHAGRRQAIAFGGELYDEHIASARTVLNPSTGAAVGARPLYPDGSRYRTGAVFIQDRIEIGSRLRATAGGRWTRVGYTTHRDAFGTADSRQTFADWTFHTAAAFQATGRLSVHGLVGRGFRAPNANDLGAIGLNDLGYEIPASEAAPAGALLGANAAEGAISLGRALTGLRPERLFNYEIGVRWNARHLQLRTQWFDSELYDPIVRRTLLFQRDRVPASLSGLAVTAIGPTPAQQAQGVVTVATSFDPRAVKAFVNDGRSRYYGVENSVRALIGSRWTFEAAHSYIVGRDLNPNRHIRRLPPQHGSASVRYATTRFWFQSSIQLSAAQDRLSGGDLDDERIGASRSRNDIAAVFQATRLAPYISGGVFVPTGETLRQVQDRVLPGVADGARVPLYAATAGWAAWNLLGGVPLTEALSLNAGAFNLFDRNYRVHGSGMDSPGINAYLALRFRF